eukprot:3234987-Prymnesium_polylepis.1
MSRIVAATTRAIVTASANGEIDILQAVLLAGADPKSVSDDGIPVVKLAAQGAHLLCVEALLVAGADPKARDKSTPRLSTTGEGTRVRGMTRVDSGAADPCAHSLVTHTSVCANARRGAQEARPPS